MVCLLQRTFIDSLCTLNLLLIYGLIAFSSFHFTTPIIRNRLQIIKCLFCITFNDLVALDVCPSYFYDHLLACFCEGLEEGNGFRRILFLIIHLLSILPTLQGFPAGRDGDASLGGDEKETISIQVFNISDSDAELLPDVLVHVFHSDG